MSRRAAIAGFVLLGTVCVALGLRTDTWWTVLGGVGAFAAAAWWITETD